MLTMAKWILLGIVYLSLAIVAVFLFFKNRDDTNTYIIRKHGKIVNRGKNGKKG
jgi:hypothetical protein